MKAMSMAMTGDNLQSEMFFSKEGGDVNVFRSRVGEKAAQYHEFLRIIAGIGDDMSKLRDAVIENRALVFDDVDFILFAQMRIQDCESESDYDNALYWRWLIEFVINTICFYD